MNSPRILYVILSAAAVTMLIGCSSTPIRTEDPLSDITEDLPPIDENERSVDEAKDDEPPVTPDLSEDDILNMSDEDLWYYADLAARGLLLHADTPNPTRSEFGITREAGYRYVGKWAPVSASNALEAMDVATAEWESQNGQMNTFENIKIIGGNDKFWLFQCDNYYLGELNMIDTLMVFNIDYYDAKNQTVKFELNDDNIRCFFSYCSMEIDIWAKICLGEYVIDDGDGFTLRKYYVNVGGGDWGMHDIAILESEDRHISSDGKVEYIGESRLRESEIPFRYTPGPSVP